MQSVRGCACLYPDSDSCTYHPQGGLIIFLIFTHLFPTRTYGFGSFGGWNWLYNYWEALEGLSNNLKENVSRIKYYVDCTCPLLRPLWSSSGPYPNH